MNFSSASDATVGIDRNADPGHRVPSDSGCNPAAESWLNDFGWCWMVEQKIMAAIKEATRPKSQAKRALSAAVVTG